MLLVVVSHQCCAVGVMCVSKHSARGGSVKHHRICIHTTLALRGLALSSPVSSWSAVGALMAHLLCFGGILEEWMKLKQPRPFCSFSQGTVRRINQKHTPKTNWNANVHALGITQRSSSMCSHWDACSLSDSGTGCGIGIKHVILGQDLGCSVPVGLRSISGWLGKSPTKGFDLSGSEG